MGSPDIEEKKYKSPGLPVFLLLSLTGFYLVLSSSWNVAYKFSIVAHLLAGVLNAVVFPLFVFRFMKREQGSRLLPWLMIPALPFIILLCIVPDLRTLYAFLVLYGILYYPSVWFVRRRLPQPVRRSFAFLAAMFFVWLAVAVTGIMMAAGINKSGINPVYIQHRWWSIVLVPFLVVFYTMPSKVGLRFEAPGRTLLLVRLACVVLIAVYAAGFIPRPSEKAYDLHLSTVIMEKRSDVEKDMAPRVPVSEKGYDLVDSCGTGRGCHAEVLKQHKVSGHNRTLWVSYFEKNFAEMVSEVGEHNTVICAGCHFPYGVLDTEDGSYKKYLGGKDCYSCSWCHLVSEVEIGPEKGKSRVSVSWHGNHIGMFLDAAGEKLPRLSEINRYLVNLNRTGHARVFMRPLYKKDEYCMLCHMRFKARNPHPSGMIKPSCNDCHMQPGEMIGMGKTRRNHFFPGASAHLPWLLGDDENYQRVMDYAEGRLGVNLPKNWQALWDVRYSDPDPLPQVIPWLLMYVDFLDAPVAGEKLGLEIHTYNTLINHPFPVASFDMLEGWLELRVTDGNGNTIYANGGLDEKNYVLPESHMLVGYMIGEDDHVILRNRVWQIKKKVIERAIGTGEKGIDKFEFTVPEDAAGPLKVSAAWRYRKLDQKFMDWAYGGELTAPPVTVGSVEMEIDMAGREQAIKDE